MRSRFLVRAQVIVLAVLAVLLLGRALRGPAVPDGLVAWTELETGELRQSALAVSRPAQVAVEAVGSFEGESDELAAHAWILDGQTRQVVWSMAQANPQRRGTVASVRDTVALGPGTYVVYFAAYGSSRSASARGSVLERLFDAEANWPNDAGAWTVIVQEVGGEDIRALRSVPAPSASAGTIVWRYDAEERGGGSAVLQVDGAAPVALRVRATGEGDPATRTMQDYVRLDDARTGEAVWAMEWADTAPAGGSPLNRCVDTTVSVAPGLYRAHYIADRNHYAGRWHLNPPFDPAAWGATLSVDEALAAHVGPLDLWGRRTPLVDLTGLGDDTAVRAELTVTEPSTIALSALGEVQDGTLYDYAWLSDADGQRLWTMSKEASTPAGGSSKNRTEVAILTLPPGNYTLYAETDGSHSYADEFNARAPDHPERWGVALFALTEAGTAPGLTAEIVEAPRDDIADIAPTTQAHASDDGWAAATRDTRPADASATASAQRPAPPDAPLPPGVLVRMTRLGNDLKREQIFRLDAPATVRIVAVGEITGRTAYDYGLIRDAAGKVVWEMTRANTKEAGGGDLNRRFDGTVTLRAGTYTAQFRTDTSHAYGDFKAGEAPSTPEAWGMEIRRVR